MFLLRITWVPPLLGFLSVVCGYLSLQFETARGVTMAASEGMKPVALISIHNKTLAVVSLALILVSLGLKFFIELNRR
jgi:hypothetical protein